MDAAGHVILRCAQDDMAMVDGKHHYLIEIHTKEGLSHDTDSQIEGPG